MGLAVAADQTGTVHGKYHRQILDTDIMQNLIEASL